jgi:class 3 adenylate cyclase
MDRPSIATNLVSIGDIYFAQSNYPVALTYFQKSLKIREELGIKKDIARSLKLIGDVYYRQGNYPLAMEYYQKSRKIQEEIGNKDGIASTLRNIGNIYYRQDNDNLALEYYQKSLKLYEEIESKDGVAACLNNIGNIYNEQGNNTMALENYQKSLKLYEEADNKQGVGYQLCNVGLIYEKQGNYALATEYYQKSLKIAEEGGDKQDLTYPLAGLAQVNLKQKSYDKSIEYSEKGLKIAQEIQAPREYRDIMGTLYETYKLKGDYLKALEYHELYKMMNDSIFDVDKAEKIANLEAIAEVERKAKEIEILNKNQEIAQKNAESLRKDAELQRIEAERQKNAKLALEKEAEAKNLLYLANQEKDKRKADSLRSLAQQKQLEVDKHLAQEEKLKAESIARKLEVLKEKEAKEFQQYINYLVLAGLFSVLVFAYFIFRSRQKEKKAKEAIAEQKEEILQMNEELNTTLQVVEEERQKSDKLLLNILPTEVASELKETGKTEVKYFEKVTVLFADVKGFSALATKISPHALITELNATFSKMDEISLRFGLERIKTIGDCYMACGGLPHSNKTHPFDAILTAIHIQHWMNEEREKNPNFWQVRLGLHTGEAVAGVIGKTKFAYDIWGSTVNLASRMESGGEVGKVNVTEQTFEIVKDYFEGSFKEEIEAKNIGKVRAYFINRLKPEFSADVFGIEPNEQFWEMHQSLKY